MRKNQNHLINQIYQIDYNNFMKSLLSNSCKYNSKNQFKALNNKYKISC